MERLQGIVRGLDVGNQISTTVVVVAILLIGFVAGCNPFAPALEEGDPLDDLLGDPRTISGYFTAFKSSYELRDIGLYEPLLDSTFRFIYFDFDSQVEREWGFTQDLESTRRLFLNSTLVRLEWNQILSQNEFDNGRQASVIRSFNLNIALDSGDEFRGDGNVNFLLAREDSTLSWKLKRWRDESEF